MKGRKEREEVGMEVKKEKMNERKETGVGKGKREERKG